MFICLFVCLLPMAGQTAGPIKTKLGMWTHVDPGSVLGNVKVMWRHLANANKTPYRGPQGWHIRGPLKGGENSSTINIWRHLVNANSLQRPTRAERIRARSAINKADRGPQGRDNRARSAINLRPEDGYLQLVVIINWFKCCKASCMPMALASGHRGSFGMKPRPVRSSRDSKSRLTHSLSCNVTECQCGCSHLMQ